MAKVNLTNIGTLTPPSSAIAALNDNVTELARAIDTLLSRDGQGPNYMEAELDMNSERILNVADPEVSHDAVNLESMQSAIAGALFDGATVYLEGDTTIRTDLANGDAGYGAELVAYNSVQTIKERIDNIEAGAGGDPTLRADLADTDGADLLGFLQTGTGASARTLQSKLRAIVDVKDFGAVGDGVEDDTAAIQAAIDAVIAGERSLLFPDGEYLISDTLVASGVFCAKALGHRGTVRIVKETDGDMLTCTSALISGISFVHNGSSGHIVELNGDDARLSDCVFANAATNTDAMVVMNRSNQVLECSSFTNNEEDAFCVLVERTASGININSKIRDCSMYGVGKGIVVTSSSGGHRVEGLSIANNKLVLTGEEHIRIITALHIDITSNMIDQSSLFCVNLAPESPGIDSISIDNNYIATASAATTGIGINTDTGSNATRHLRIIDNHFELCDYGAYIADSVSTCVIMGNTFDNINTTSLEVREALVVSIVGNSFRGSATHLDVADGVAGGPMSVVGNSFPGTGTVALTKTNEANFGFSANVGEKFSGWGSAVSGAIAAGSSSFLNVPHGLTVAPPISKILASVSTASGGFQAVSVNIISVDATNVTVELFYTVVSPGTLRVNVFSSC